MEESLDDPGQLNTLLSRKWEEEDDFGDELS